MAQLAGNPVYARETASSLYRMASDEQGIARYLSAPHNQQEDSKFEYVVLNRIRDKHDDHSALPLMAALAMYYRDTNRLDESYLQYQKICLMLDRYSEQKFLDQASTFSNAAEACNILRRYTEALNYDKRAFIQGAKSTPFSVIRKVSLLDKIKAAQIRAGEWNEALKTAKEERRALLSGDNSNLKQDERLELLAKCALGPLDPQRKNSDADAITFDQKIYQELLSTGSDADNLETVIGNLSQLLVNAKDYDSLVKLADESAKIEFAPRWFTHAWLYLDDKQESEAVGKRMLDVLNRRLGGDNEYTLGTERNLADTFYWHQKYSEAYPLALDSWLRGLRTQPSTWCSSKTMIPIKLLKHLNKEFDARYIQTISSWSIL